MPKVKVIFPSVLVKVTAGDKATEVFASTLGDALDKLAAKYGDTFKEKIFDSRGKLKRLLNFSVNGKNVRLLKQLETPLEEGDEVFIFPSVSGG